MSQTNTSNVSARPSVEERYLLEVLSAFFNDADAPAPPEDLDPYELTLLADRQNVAQILAYMALKTPGAIPVDVLVKCGSKLNAAVQNETLQTAEFNALNQAFRAGGVRYMPLKGFLMRELYPEPYLRTMTDYDVLVEQEDFDKAREVLVKQGYEYLKGDELHDVYVKSKRFVVEQHYKLFAASAAYERGRNVSWNRLVHYEATEYRFTPEDFYRYMLEHLLKHWLGSQTTLRDYLDVAIYLRARGGELDRAKLDADLQRSGVLDFVKNVERLADAWFNGKELDPVLEEMALYQFRRHEINAKTNEEGSICNYASYLAGAAKTGKFGRFARIRYLLTIFPQRAAYEVSHHLEGVPAWKKPFTAVKLFCQVWWRRLTRKSFYRNLRGFLGANVSETSTATAFQRRAGLDPSRFNAEDWKEED